MRRFRHANPRVESSDSARFSFLIIQLINQWKSDGKINAGVANSMIVKVVNALKSYDQGNIADAGSKLNALKNEINAKVKPGSLSAADATLAFSLIDALYASMIP